MIKTIAIRHYYKNNVNCGKDYNIREFSNIEQAIKYAHRYAKNNLQLGGVHIEDDDGRLVYEITSNFNVYDYRSMELTNIFNIKEKQKKITIINKRSDLKW